MAVEIDINDIIGSEISMFMRYTRTSTSSIKMNKLTIITLLLPSLFIVGCKNNAETITPKITNIVESVYASGVVKSKNQYDVFTKINGKIETIFVVEGQLVQKVTLYLKSKIKIQT